MNIYIDIYVCVIHINRRRLDYRVMSCNMSSCIYGSKLPTILPNTTHLGAASRQPSFSDISMDYIQLKPVSSTPDEGVPETKNHHRAVCERKKNTTEKDIHITSKYANMSTPFTFAASPTTPYPRAFYTGQKKKEAINRNGSRGGKMKMTSIIEIVPVHISPQSSISSFIYSSIWKGLLGDHKG